MVRHSFDQGLRVVWWTHQFGEDRGEHNRLLKILRLQFYTGLYFI